MTAHSASPAPRLTGFRGGAFQAFRWLAALLALEIIVQICLAGYGAFKLIGDPSEGDDAFEVHAGFAFTAIHLTALLLAVAVLLSRPGRNLVIAGIVLALDAIVLQTILAGIGEDNPEVGMLHPLNALVLLGLSLYCHLQSNRIARGSTAAVV